MTFSIGIVGAGQFGGQFAHLFNLHPGVKEVYVVDERPERAAEAVDRYDLAGACATVREFLEALTNWYVGELPASSGIVVLDCKVTPEAEGWRGISLA